MYCIKCGTELPDDALYCTKCGAQTGNNPAPDVEITQDPDEEENFCEICGNQIEDPDLPCPYCTQTKSLPRRRMSDGKKVIVILAVIIVVCYIAEAVINTVINSLDGSSPARVPSSSSGSTYSTGTTTTAEEQKAEFIESCTTLNYEAVSRRPNLYTGKNIVITGEVIQVTESLFSSVVLRVESDDGIWYVTYKKSSGEPNILEDDIITAYGVCQGTETYTTILGASVTIPALEMKYYEIGEKAADNKNKVEYEITQNRITVWDRSGSTYYMGIVEVTNTGEDIIFLDTGSFDIETADGKLIASDKYVYVYPQIIKPGEKAYYYEYGDLDNADPNAQYKITPRVDVEKSKVDPIFLGTSDFRLENREYGGLKVIGRITNTTNEEQSYARVAVICFDKDGAPLTVIYDSVSDIKPGETSGIEMHEYILPDDITAESVGSFVVYSYLTQYNW